MVLGLCFLKVVVGLGALWARILLVRRCFHGGRLPRDVRGGVLLALSRVAFVTPLATP